VLPPASLRHAPSEHFTLFITAGSRIEIARTSAVVLVVFAGRWLSACLSASAPLGLVIVSAVSVDVHIPIRHRYPPASAATTQPAQELMSRTCSSSYQPSVIIGMFG